MTVMHELKCEPNYLYDITNDKKSFEIRYNDRNFEVGDFLFLRSYYAIDERLGPHWALVKVTYMVKSEKYNKDGYVTMSIKLIDFGRDY